eukprot:TRINITY_DN103193_c0_g1_i1.p1 TRINITY_DN103193_c0_g1~~TRINITY_DN103193_c0_g1_i1.p1  ORF type:complete len:367 (+),score=67.55 TRINITY_DN103193_c0_g1_i1:66-1166(+)
MISTCEGPYNLKGKSGVPKQGNYKFTPELDCADFGVLTDQSSGAGASEVVGRFSYAPIGKMSLPADECAAEAEIPSIGITESEIMAEIQKPSSEGAYFVLPSQLNGAEYPSHHTVVNALQDYMTDNTGGPRGQLAVHPAAGQFVIDNAASDRKPGGINAVDAILQKAPDFKLVNGYLEMPLPKDEGQKDEWLKAFVDNLGTLRPLIMSEVQACGLTPDKAAFSTATHKVNLVYASAVPVEAYLNRPTTPLHKAFHDKVAESVLVAQYYGALKAAAKSSGEAAKSSGPGKAPVKVFLMPLGGGVFNNSWESIAKSMSVAVEMLGQEHELLDELLDIQVLTWNGNPQEKEKMKRLLDHHKKFKPSRAA